MTPLMRHSSLLMSTICLPNTCFWILLLLPSYTDTMEFHFSRFSQGIHIFHMEECPTGTDSSHCS